MKLIKIKVNEEDRDTVAKMLDYAISRAVQFLDYSFDIERSNYWEKEIEKFKDIRQRVVYEETN